MPKVALVTVENGNPNVCNQNVGVGECKNNESSSVVSRLSSLHLLLLCQLVVAQLYSSVSKHVSRDSSQYLGIRC